MFWSTEDKKLKCIFDWISTVATSYDVVRCDYPSVTPQYFSFAFPIRPGVRPKKLPTSGGVTRETFIVSFINKHDPPNEEEWTSIFSLPLLTVYEKKSRHQASLPLRFGLTEDEKTAAVQHARSTLTEVILGTEEAKKKKLPRRFDLGIDVAVAIWVDGALRGSQVIEKLRLSEGIATATRGAGSDIRFKPVQEKELPNVRIEITCLGDLKIPLARDDIQRNQIYPGKGYVYMGHQKKGWYLPEVFNVKRFDTLHEFLESLVKEKAKNLDFLPYRDSSRVSVFNVFDFVENEERLPVVIFPQTMSTDFEIDQAAHAAAEWLVRIQETDGNYPAVTSSDGIIKKQIDWIRLACTTAALMEFGKIVNNETYLHSAQRAFAYLQMYIIAKKFPIEQRTIVLSYMSYTAESIGNIALVAEIAREVERLLLTQTFEPILFSHATNSIKMGSVYDRGLFAKNAELLSLLKNRFLSARNSGETMSLAGWAELASIFYSSEPLFSQEISDWLISYQSQEGYFPSTTSNVLPYVRGTAKIYEVLALSPHKYTAPNGRAAQWIMSMQYTKDRLYCIAPAQRGKILGGFRHDYFNSDLWIDSAAHFLLGTARRMNNEITKQ